MKNILKSLIIVTAVAAAVIGGTIAYFSDEEKSTGDVISAGTIDIAVDGENPWDSTAQYSFTGLEPSDERNINVTLSNVGTNPVVIWKKVKVTAESDNIKSEPECVAGGGTWTEGADTCTGLYVPVDNISSQFVYSMKIGGTDNIKRAWDVKVSDVNDLWIPIGRLNSNDTKTVEQNYYFDENAGNEYQGDSMTLDITFYAEQLDAPGPAHTTRGVVLENKNTATDWAPIVGDGIWGILTWDNAGVYTAKAWGMNSDIYKLVYWDGTAPENQIGSTQTGIDLTFSGTYAGFTTNPNGAKYWVRPNTWTSSSDANSLYEANLVD